MAYKSLLGALAGPGAGAGGGVGSPPAASLGTGAAPVLPDMPPAPTNTGAIPTGDPSTTSKAAADQCILALRECRGHYPSLGHAIDGMIDQLKSVARGAPGTPPAPPPTPAPALGQPSPPGTETPAITPIASSGSPGAQ